MAYLKWCYKDNLSEYDIDKDFKYPHCNVSNTYLYKNNGSKGQLMCKVCDTKFSPEENQWRKFTAGIKKLDSICDVFQINELIPF